ncbi:MAG: CDP-alcohol phosphatidyltransferase family protein [Bacteroidota bacterium]
MNSTLALQLKIEQWSRFHAGIIIIAVIGFILGSSPLPIALLGLSSFAAYWYLNRESWQALSKWGGAANLVTAARLLTLVLIGIWGHHLGNWIVGGLALIVLLTDGLDGYLARKYQTQSLFGEYFDKETDAFFVMMLGSLAWYEGYVGPWILSLGLLRYVYVFLLIFVKPPEKKESRSFRGQLIAVILMSSLIGCFWLPEWLYMPALVIVSALVFYSFGMSFWGMISTNRRASVQTKKKKEAVNKAIL